MKFVLVCSYLTNLRIRTLTSLITFSYRSKILLPSEHVHSLLVYTLEMDRLPLVISSPHSAVSSEVIMELTGHFLYL